MPMSLRDEAEALAIALEIGFASIEDVIDWADAKIVALDQPPYELIEVSCAGRQAVPDVAHALRAIAGTPDVAAASKIVIARMAAALDRGSTTAEKVARALYRMSLNGHVPEASAEGAMVGLDDAFDLAHGGTYGSIEDAESDVRSFLSRYAL